MRADETQLGDEQADCDHLAPPTWNGGRLTLARYRGVVTVDTANAMISYRRDEHVAEMWQQIQTRHVSPVEMAGGALLYVRGVDIKGRPRDSLELQIRNNRNGRGNTISIRTVDEVQSVVLPASRQAAIIHYQVGGNHRRLVVDATGQVMADLE